MLHYWAIRQFDNAICVIYKPDSPALVVTGGRLFNHQLNGRLLHAGRRLGASMTAHGAIMVNTGLGFGLALVRAGVLPLWAGVGLMVESSRSR